MSILDRFFQVEREKYGKGDYFFKGDTFGSKVRAFYARAFCPRYSEDFTTTIYPNTHFALCKVGRPRSCVETEFHENVHKWDRWNEGFKFNLKYLWPHWMALPFLVAVIALSGWKGLVAFGVLLVLLHVALIVLWASARKSQKDVPSGGAYTLLYVVALFGTIALVVVSVLEARYWALLWLGAVLFLSPWPLKPFWRRDYEIRGYTMSLYRVYLKHQDDFDEHKWRETIDKYVEIFAGPEYLFMELDRKKVQREFLFQSGRLQFSEEGFLRNWIWSDSVGRPSSAEAEPFRMAKQFIEREGFGG